MKNAETPAIKVALFGALSSFGSALMAELLRRQHEVIAIVDDPDTLKPRRRLRIKRGNLFDTERVCEGIAGCSVVICLLEPKATPAALVGLTPEAQLIATHTLLTCMDRTHLKRLILVADIHLLHGQPLPDYQDPDLDQFQASALIVDALRKSAAEWTLVSAPEGIAGVGILHYSPTGHTQVVSQAVLERVANGIAEEMRLNLHVRQYVNFVV
ncbi:NAD(P)-dependent oxidoreductase [Pseudomonas sp. NPDC090202]|uniref:NAD(P)-dependent oxidoreductase n=1 Tax=unclassified Pseudomonas TaxID=196821 RepID=UPI0037F42337